MVRIPTHRLATKSRLALGKMNGESFADFVCRVLANDYPGLKRFGSHKDGAIDLAADNKDHRRTVIQCKSMTGASSTPRSAWQNEMTKLRESLNVDRDGKLTVESQYEPWRDAERPISRYVFCHNKVLPDHQRGTDKARTESAYLRGKITSFFTKEISIRPGFKHFASLEVIVHSGDEFADRCDQQKRLAFDLFGTDLPSGISRVDTLVAEGRDALSFSAYLSDKLPYLSRAMFRERER